MFCIVTQYIVRKVVIFYVKRLPLIWIFLLASLRVLAQQDVSFAHYWAMEPSFNPAAVGKESKINITGAYQLSMAGYEQHPRTMNLAADMSFRLLNMTHGVGIQLLNDEIGLFTHKRMALQYALQCRLFGGHLRFGLQAGVLSEGFKGSELDAENSSDPALPTADVNGTAFDFSGGLYYLHRNWYVGVSVLHATAPAVEMGNRSLLQVDRIYYLTAGYTFRLRNPHLAILPSVLAYTDGTSQRADFTARLRYTNDEKMLYGGVGYSPTNSVTAMIGGNFHGVHIGYSYEMYTTGTGIGNGSHELFVGYQTNIDIGPRRRNRHQSVRIL